MGDSAVSNLSLVTLQRIRRAGEPAPACAVLVSPAVDCTLDSAGMVESQGRGPMLRLSDLLVLRRHYVPSPHLYTHPEMSPLFGDFTGLPPLLLLIGSSEMLRHEAMRTAHKAHAAGVDVALERWQGTPHVFPVAPFLSEAAHAWRGCGGRTIWRLPGKLSRWRATSNAFLASGALRIVDLINGPDTWQNLPAISVAQQLHPPLSKGPAIRGVAAKPDTKVLRGGVTGHPTTITKTGHAKMS
jgi:acetyl esterase/lipase